MASSTQGFSTIKADTRVSQSVTGALIKLSFENEKHVSICVSLGEHSEAVVLCVTVKLESLRRDTLVELDISSAQRIGNASRFLEINVLYWDSVKREGKGS